jgi:hypothetical protein
MMFSQYLRIEESAGGVNASRFQMLRAFRRSLNDVGKSRQMRDRRHRLAREMLSWHQIAQKTANL